MKKQKVARKEQTAVGHRTLYEAEQAEMSMNKETIYRHKSLRNPTINYRSGWWSVSIQVAKNKSIFGAIVGDKVVLNELGLAVKAYWRALPEKYPELEIFDFVVMPNHFHALLRIHFRPTNREHHLGFLMSRFKGGTSFSIERADVGTVREPSVRSGCDDRRGRFPS